MIGRLTGTLLEKRPPALLLDIQGVGYEVEAPMTTFYELPEASHSVTLHIHQVVRDDGHYLYGFYRERERNIFRQLLRVNGVGAKLALAILSGMDANTFSQCVQAGDTATLTRLPGVGKKTAERLVIEMRDRLIGLPETADHPTSAGPNPGPTGGDVIAEAVSALVALGLKPQEASRQVHAIDGEGLSCEDIVRRALQSMVK